MSPVRVIISTLPRSVTLDGDFQVDQDDLDLIESLVGQASDSADLDGDGVVDQDDVDIVSANLGQSAW